MRQAQSDLIDRHTSNLWHSQFPTNYELETSTGSFRSTPTSHKDRFLIRGGLKIFSVKQALESSKKTHRFTARQIIDARIPPEKPQKYLCGQRKYISYQKAGQMFN